MPFFVLLLRAQVLTSSVPPLPQSWKQPRAPGTQGHFFILRTTVTTRRTLDLGGEISVLFCHPGENTAKNQLEEGQKSHQARPDKDGRYLVVLELAKEKSTVSTLPATNRCESRKPQGKSHL